LVTLENLHTYDALLKR